MNETEMTAQDWNDFATARAEAAKSLGYAEWQRQEEETIQHFIKQHPGTDLIVAENGKQRTVSFRSSMARTKFRICTLYFVEHRFIIH